MLRISLSGTHCTGKTTLLKAIESDRFFEEWDIIPGPTRSVKQGGLPINNDEANNYDLTQVMCAMYDIDKLSVKQFGDVISDRCLFDTLIYTRYLSSIGKISQPILDLIEKLWERERVNYSFLLIPSTKDVQLVRDSDRNNDSDFRLGVESLVYQELDKGLIRFFDIQGDTITRLQTIKQIINNESKYRK